MSEPNYSGKFVTKKKTRPAIQSKLYIPALRLEVRPQQNVPPHQLQQLSDMIVQKLVDAVPEQKLIYDSKQSKLVEDSAGTSLVVIVLVPKTPTADIDDVYLELCEMARKTVEPFNVIVLDSRDEVLCGLASLL